MPHVVAALFRPDAHIFELAVVHEVFGLPRPELEIDPYEFVVCSESPGTMMETPWGIRAEIAHGLEALARADTVVIPSASTESPASDQVISAVRAAHSRGARLVSVCSGSFVLAQAGLLDGRSATTHWLYTDRLAERYPKVRVEADVLYVDDDPIYTSAGTAAGIDLCLYLLRQDHGAEVANKVARRMVVPPHRDGGQAQFVDSPVPEPVDDPLARTLDWAIDHLDEPLTVEDLARHALLSPRTLARRFVAVVGTTPHQWMIRQRVLHARRLLETTDLHIDTIALRCGFGSSAVLRTHFGRLVGTSPSAYRLTFRGNVRTA